MAATNDIPSPTHDEFGSTGEITIGGEVFSDRFFEIDVSQVKVSGFSSFISKYQNLVIDGHTIDVENKTND